MSECKEVDRYGDLYCLKCLLPKCVLDGNKPTPKHKATRVEHAGEPLEYYWAHREEVLERVRIYQRAHREEVLERKRKYRLAHREELNKKNREYYRTHYDNNRLVKILT